MYCFEKRFIMINVQFWKTLYNNQCTVLKNALQWSMYCFEKRFTMINVLFLTLYNDHCTVLKNALQWSMFCCERRSTIDQCSVFEKPSAMINVPFLKNPPQWSMYSFEKRSTIINVLFWKTLYNDQCTVWKNALQ